MYLLDTNVICETIKKTPDQKVVDFLSSIPIQKFSLSVITLGEIRKGVEKMGDATKKQKILKWLETDLQNQFCGRMINIDSAVADKWGYISSILNVPPIDALIAASAIVHNHKLVTRNVKDFKGIVGLEIINPWEAAC